MAVFKCKTCGGDVEPLNDGIIGKCLYCGSMQTLPKEKDEKISQLLNRANDFRLNSDFDRAIFEYEKVLELDEAEPEAHWGIFLSKYGVEYVKDTMTQMYKPTLHRISTVSVYDDVDYQATLKYASYGAAMQYKEDAEHIEMVMKELLLLSANQEPYDIFLSYKELDDVTRQRTDDSYLAHDLYNELTAQGYRVFFAPKSLIGVSLYEPKIYSAIISSKVMIVLGTRPEYLMGVWVKNEWSRFAEAIENGEEKVLIPVFKNMEASQLPNRIAKYQAYNMASMTFLPSLFDAVSKSVKRDNRLDFNKNSSAEDAFVERGFLALEDREFSEADSFFEKALNINPHNSQVYFGKLMVEMRINKKEQILTSSQSLKNYKNFEKALRFADQQLKTVLLQYEEKVQYTLDEQEYNRAMAIVNGSLLSINDYENAVDIFKSISNFKDSKEKEAFCLEKIDAIKKDAVLDEAKSKMIGNRISNYNDAIEIFDTIPGWKDADKCVIECNRIIAEIKAKEEADRIECERQAEIAKIKAQENIKRIKKLATIITPIICVIIVVTGLLNNVIIPNAKYKDAVALMDEGKYSEAIAAFEALDGYKDSYDKIVDCETAIETAILDGKYNEAIALMEDGKFEEAIEIFEKLDGYKDSENKIDECTTNVKDVLYDNAQSLLKDKKYAEAAIAFGKLGNYKDAEQKCNDLWKKVAIRVSLSAYIHTVGLKNDGTVVAVGFNLDDQCDVSKWKDIVAISAGFKHTVGLKSDGTVVAVGSNYYGQCDVSDWKDIVAISAGYVHTVGLKSDGTVVAVGDNDYGQCNVSDWKDIVAISAGGFHTVGLKTDGTVVTVGDNDYGQCNVSDWKDIVAISASNYHTVGLKSDGTVVAVGDNDYGECDVSDWKDIVAISAGEDHTVGLKSNGTVIAVGENDDGKCNVSGWKNIVSISAGANYTVGLKTDGTVIAVGKNNFGQCNVSKWKNIKLPENK